MTTATAAGSAFLDQVAAGAQSLAVHAVIGVALFFGVQMTSETIQPKFPDAIQAVVVDTSALKAERDRRRQAEQNKLRDAAIARRQEAEALVEKKRQAELEQLKRQQAEDARQQRVMDERRKQQELQKRQAELKAEREKLVAEREQQQREFDAIKAQREAEELAQQKALEEARRQQIIDVENSERQAGQDLTLMEEWVGLIAVKVRQNWRKPPTAKAGERCRVLVNQLPGGDVINASVAPGCRLDEVTKRSIVDAVLRSEPLPYRGYERVFRRQLTFEFLVD